MRRAHTQTQNTPPPSKLSAVSMIHQVHGDIDMTHDRYRVAGSPRRHLVRPSLLVITLALLMFQKTRPYGILNTEFECF
jgi:hypothetical protein